VQAVRWSAENRQRDPPSGWILSIRNILADRNEGIESSGPGSLQEAPVLQPRQIGEAGRLAVVAGKQTPQTLWLGRAPLSGWW
jgi:hypothetical protein